ncbi:MAG: FAD-binding oxidoreductase [Gammaproteobacteria bacterium]|nr:FAD-binding oxidoreductase [Gammaproteobacteria bacterium]
MAVTEIKPYQTVNDQTCGWIHTIPPAPRFPCLEENKQVDWVIIGAGFTGLSAAYRIAELNPDDSIILLDAEQAGKGASSRNSGYIVDITLNDGGSTLADEQTQLAKSQLNRAGMDLLRQRVEQYNIPCDWDESGKFHCASDRRNIPKLKNFEGFLERAGLEHQVWRKDKLNERLGTSYYQHAVQTKSGILVNPAGLINGLVQNLPESVELYEQSPVLQIEQGEVIRLTTAKGSISADRVIVAVNALMPRNGFKANRVFPLTLTASMSRPLNPAEYESIGKPQPWGVLSASSMGATVRFTNDHRIMVRNTVEWWPSLTMNPDELTIRRQRNLSGLRRRFPDLTNLDFEYSWSGNVCISRNSKPVFEKATNNLFLAGCYNAGGIAMGSLFGKLIVDYALNHESNELTQVLNQEKPTIIPPRPFFDIGLQTRLAFNRFMGRAEA